MLKTEVEVDNLKKEIECLREENEKLKQQLSNYNHSTIHNNNNDLESDNDMSNISEYEKWLNEQPNYFEDSINEIEETRILNTDDIIESNRLVWGL